MTAIRFQQLIIEKASLWMEINYWMTRDKESPPSRFESVIDAYFRRESLPAHRIWSYVVLSDYGGLHGRGKR